MSNVIEVSNVTMKFNMSKERIENLKDYAIKFVKRQLRYEEFIALDDLSFSVEKGDVFGIVGLNGSGKSTLLKIVSGILKPTAGNVCVSGSVAPLIELGAGFDMELTARENIYLNGSVLGYSKRYLDEHFDEIVDFSEMREFLDVPMKNYSSGMVARVGFAIATMTKPEILIVDEILSVGDYKFQEKCERRIADMMHGGTTVLIVSHSIAQIERLCKHALWLETGKLKMIGDVRDVCAAYQGKPLPNKKAVYTAILGGYDNLKTPSCAAEGWDYICFTDNPELSSDFWQIRYCEKPALIESGASDVENPRRLGKFFKMNPRLLLPEYDESLWVDGSFDIVGDINEYIGAYLKDADMLCFAHPERDCIYDEATICVASGLALKSETDRQMTRYREAGMPEHFGLIAGGLLYRRHTDKLTELNNLWYSETMNGTPRDQLSFSYCCYKLGFTYDTCPLNYWDNPYFKHSPHRVGSNIVTASLYVETVDSPFSEETSAKAILGFPDNRFEAEFFPRPESHGITRFRFDPAELPVKAKVTSAVLVDDSGNEHALSLLGTNADREEDGFYIFDSPDPNIYYGLPANIEVKSVVFIGEMYFIKNNNETKQYDTDFYLQRKALTLRSASVVVPVILSFLPADMKKNFSVIDFGCGTGDWLKYYKEYGAKKIVGVDSSDIKPSLMEIPFEDFFHHNLNEKFQTDEKFTICQCLEVAEHLDEQYANMLLESLTTASDIIVFSAAIPFQEGTHHVNLQWPDYWVKKFHDFGYLEVDCIRRLVWNESSVNVIYRQNMMVYFRDTVVNSFLKKLRKENRPDQYNLVHPDLWMIYRQH